MFKSAIEKRMSVLAVLSCMAATPTWGQVNPDEVDLKIANSDISLPDVALLGSNVNIGANVHNLGESYIVLGNVNDQVDYGGWSGSASAYGVEIRLRSTGGFVGLVAWVDNLPIPTAISTNSTTWTTITLSPTGVIAGGTHTLHLRLATTTGGSAEIDSIRLFQVAGSDLLVEEAERYTGGGASVNDIVPRDPTVQFFDGDPGAGGTQIGFDQVVGATTTVGGSTVRYIADGESVLANQIWAAGPLGNHSIFVRVFPDLAEPAANVGNEQGVDTINVILPGEAIPTVSEWGLIVLSILLIAAAVYMLQKRQGGLQTG